jgi:transposase
MRCEHCQLTGQVETGTFPAHITGSKQYGIGVSALAVTLLTLGMVSVDRTQKLMSSLGIPISKGKIQDALAIAAKKVQPALDLIKTMILLQFVLHFDETGVRVAGKLNWLHCACTDKWRLYSVEEKRGKEGIEAMGILPLANCVVVHDFWKPYLNYDNVLHAMCCAHLERELVYTEESGKQDWAKGLRELLQTMCHRRAVLTVEGADAFPKQELDGYLQQYDKLVEEGMKANPVPEKVPGKRGRTGKGRFRCLLERFRDFKEDILRFARDWRVPFTNNTAERAIRWAKVKDKVSGCFRSKAGADDFAAVLSFVSTAALHGLSSFDALKSLFSGNAFQLVEEWDD